VHRRLRSKDLAAVTLAHMSADSRSYHTGKTWYPYLCAKDSKNAGQLLW